MIKAYEVSDGFHDVYCETLEDARLVSKELVRRLKVIGYAGRVTICECEIMSIPDSERSFVEQLRASQQSGGGESEAG